MAPICNVRAVFSVLPLLIVTGVLTVAAGLPQASAAQTAKGAHWWSAAVDQSLKNAGPNRPELLKALNTAPSSQREGLQFLIEYMPEPDLKSLTAAYLLENVAIAYEGLDRAPWRDSISKAVFLNDVLPYACLNEKRDESRKFLQEKVAPLIAGCKTPGEAAQVLNKQLFPLLNARYSTERKRPDQSPLETVESGRATCSGLSILLVDACRAVGVPARVVGTPMWTNMRGNHTWVEVWDDGWHYVGAAEPDAAGLDHGWFAGDASKAIKNVPEHAIYASSFRKTGVSFPLVWAPEIAWVNAENVTDRYTQGAAPAGAANASMSRIMVRVLDANGKRLAVPVTLREAGAAPLTGVTRGEAADLNDLLGLEVDRTCPPRKFQITAEVNGKAITRTVMAGVDSEELVTLRLPSATDSALSALLADRFGVDDAKRAAARRRLAPMRPTEANRKLAWEVYKASPLHEELRKQFEQKIIATDDRTSPYLWRHVGVKPDGGWALVIAMHGGGGAPKQVNDNEWNYMFSTYYKEHPEAGGYVYLALRAPNDTWNGFYDDAISPLIEKLIKQFVLFDDVNPNRVYVMGASHGGYGAYVIGPKIPYRFAAIHAAASAETDGETMGENLRNVRFTSMVGEQDTAYGRIDRGRKFESRMDAWRKEYNGGYDSAFDFPANTGHLVPDHDKLAEMLKYTRDAAPKDVVWTESDNVIKRNYWIEDDNPKAGDHIRATVENNGIHLEAPLHKRLILWLDPRLIDFSKGSWLDFVADADLKSHVKSPIAAVRVGPDKKPAGLGPGGSLTNFGFMLSDIQGSLETDCESIEETADPYLPGSVRLEVQL